MTVFPSNPTSNQQVVFNSITYQWNGSRWVSLGDSAVTPIARGGTGSATAPMIGVVTAADAAAAQSVLGGTTVGKAVFVAADAAAARTAIGVTNIGSYTGQIETVADKTYTLDPSTATARTITGFYIRSTSGTVTATLKNGTATVDAAPVTNTSGNRNPGAFANTSVLINGLITIVTSSNSTALNVIFAVEYTE